MHLCALLKEFTMFDNRFSHDNGQAGTATLDPSANGKAAASPSTNGRNGPTVADVASVGANSSPSTNGRNGADAGRFGDNAPSTNGANGETTTARTGAASCPTGRQAGGRFAKGTAGGPGNPFARKVAALRSALIDAVTPEDIQQIAAKLMHQAKDGDVQSAKLLFTFVIGKPAPAPQPDNLDVEEWQGFQREATMMGGLQGVIQNPAPELPLGIVRAARPEITKSYGQLVGNTMSMPLPEARDQWNNYQALPGHKQPAQLEKMMRQAAAKGRKGPSTNGKKR
jgi:hypothetical protein